MLVAPSISVVKFPTATEVKFPAYYTEPFFGKNSPFPHL